MTQTNLLIIFLFTFCSPTLQQLIRRFESIVLLIFSLFHSRCFPLFPFLSLCFSNSRTLFSLSLSLSLFLYLALFLLLSRPLSVSLSLSLSLFFSFLLLLLLTFPLHFLNLFLFLFSDGF